ncbi:MAG: glycoside hydrolase family 28 protein [Mangrovibacterium sp.]
MIKKTFITLASTSLLVASSCCPNSNNSTPKENNPLAGLTIPFDMPEVQQTSFKPDTLNIIDFGAEPNKHSLCTEAINTAIKTCSSNGGGVVLIPAGLWTTGPIYMQSNVNLHTASGAFISFTPDVAQYQLIQSYFEGNSVLRCESPIMGINLENVAITGKGIFDGNGIAWRIIKKEKMTNNQWNTIIKQGALSDDGKRWYPDTFYRDAQEGLIQMPQTQTAENMANYKRYLRPVMVSFVNCSKLKLDGVTFQNSPAWNVNPLMCEHVVISNLTIRNPWYSQNGDGLDLESCRIGTISNCTFDVGDDAICIKSGKDKEGRDRAKPTELFVITDCVVYHGHGGFVLGSEMSGGVNNIYAKNLTFIGTDCGLRFKSTRGRGGVVENIWMENIRMSEIPTEAIRFNLYYAGKSATEDPITGDLIVEEAQVSEETPVFRNMHFKDIFVDGAQMAIKAMGIPEMPVENISFDHLIIRANEGINMNYTSKFNFSNVKLKLEKEGVAAKISNSQDCEFNSFDVTGENQLFQIGGTTSKNISLNLKNRQLTNSDISVLESIKEQVKIRN